MQKDIIIIGGGIAGMSCATALAQSGHKVQLIESQEKLGGLAGGFQEPHWKSSLEIYYHHWFKTDTYVFRYAKIWNALDGIIFKRPISVVETPSGQFVPLDSPLALLRYPELNLPQRLRMGLALANLKIRKDWHNLEKIPAHTWCKTYMGEAGYKAIWEPLLLGKFGPEFAENVNMAWLWSRLVSRTAELGTYSGGMQAFIDKAEQSMLNMGIKIYKNTSLEKVERLNSKWILTTKTGEKLEASIVVATLPSPIFEKLFAPFIPDSYLKKLNTTQSLGVKEIIFASKKPLGKYYWYSLRRTDTYPYLALIEHTNFVDPKEFGGEYIFYLAKYISPKSDEWNMPFEQEVAQAIKTCQKINPTFQENDILRTYSYSSPYAQPVMEVNASQSIPPVAVSEGLYHGNLRHIYPWDRGTNYALELGENIAKQIIQNSC